MADRQWPDPRGWEALTQQEAEQDARARTLPGLIDDCRHRYRTTPCVPVLRLADAAESLLAALAVAVRERDHAHDALRQAHVWVTDAIEEQGETDDDLLAQPGTMWVRLICARNVARAALDGGQT